MQRTPNRTSATSLLLGTALSLAAFLSPRPADASVGNYDGAVARGDFNNDGEEDVVVSSPFDDCGKGVIHIRSSGSVVSWTRDTSGVMATAACNQFFGTALATGDFDGDGYDDLAVSAPGASDTGDTRSGAVHVFYGRSTGLSTIGDQVWNQDTTGVQGAAEPYDYMGDALAVGDFDCDGFDDLAIGVPREDLSAGADAGAAHVLYGSSGGMSTVDDWWHQNVSGVNNSVQPGDNFGAALAAGNFNGDTFATRACDDLVIGIPDEDINSSADTGLIYIMDGSSSGLSTTGDQSLHQDMSNLEGAAEANDHFGERLVVINDNGDAYDDLAVSVPGDACQSGMGEGTHVLHGSAIGVSKDDDRIVCNTYRCENFETAYGCMSNSPAIYATTSSDVLSLFVGDDEVWAGSGNDEIRGDHGDDVVFGGYGNDTFKMGPGADIAIGGSGNDTFEIGLTCAAAAGEVIDGGSGTDVVRSHLSQSQLVAAGVTLRSIETFVTIPEYYAGDCGPYAYDEGPTVPPRLEISWVDLADADDTYLTSNGYVRIDVENTSDDDVDYDLVFHLSIRGSQLAVEDSDLHLDAGDDTRRSFQLSRFIPSGVDLQSVPADVLILPTSAQIRIEAKIRKPGKTTEIGRAFSVPVWGHHESDEARLYREDLFSTTYQHGNLVAWRAGGHQITRPYRYAGHLEATTPKEPK